MIADDLVIAKISSSWLLMVEICHRNMWPDFIVPFWHCVDSTDLEDSQQGTGDGVEVWCGRALVKVEESPEELHSKEGKDEDEKEEEEEEGQNGRDGVHQGNHQIPQRRPVPAKKKKGKSTKMKKMSAKENPSPGHLIFKNIKWRGQKSCSSFKASGLKFWHRPHAIR